MTKQIEQSVKEKVRTIAQQESRTFNDVWQGVILERWLARLAASPYKKNFIFKGAKCLGQYVNIQRETRDLDFLIKNLTASIQDVKEYLSEVSKLDLNDGFTFENFEIDNLSHTHMKYPGYAISIISRLGDTKTKVFIDIGVGDSVKPIELNFKLMSTSKAPLFEKKIHLWAYPVESIFSEKLETAITRSTQNSRMKDYHDLLVLIREEILDQQKVSMAIHETFNNRGTKIQKLIHPKDQFPIIQNYWNQYLKQLPPTVRSRLNDDLFEVIQEINFFLNKAVRIDLFFS